MNYQAEMNYQPDLFVFNIGNSTPKTIYNVIHELGLGKIQYIEIDGEHAFVAMNEWHINQTISTRMKLNQGKPLLLHHTETNFWKVYSYENRYIEEMKKENERKQNERKQNEQKKKEQKENEQKEIEEKLKERDLKMQLLKKEHQEIIMKKEKLYKEILDL
jgi:pyruvate/2-oxoacid:ferredoxin oxidoreductase beta subunit